MAEPDSLGLSQKLTELQHATAALLETRISLLATSPPDPSESRRLEAVVAVLRGAQSNDSLESASVLWARCTTSSDAPLNTKRNATSFLLPVSALIDAIAVAVAPRFIEDVADIAVGRLILGRADSSLGAGLAVQLMCAVVLTAARTPLVQRWTTAVLPWFLTWRRFANYDLAIRQCLWNFHGMLRHLSPEALQPTAERALTELWETEIGSAAHEGIMVMSGAARLCDRFLRIDSPRYARIQALATNFFVRRLIRSLRDNELEMTLRVIRLISTHLGADCAPESKVAYVRSGLLAAMRGAEWILRQSDELTLRYLAVWEAITRDPIAPPLEQAIARHASFDELFRALGGKFKPTARVVLDRLIKSPAILLGMICDDALLVLADVANAPGGGIQSDATAVAQQIAARASSFKFTLTDAAAEDILGPYKMRSAGDTDKGAVVVFNARDTLMSAVAPLEFARKISRRIDRDYRRLVREGKVPSGSGPTSPVLAYTDTAEVIAAIESLFSPDIMTRNWLASPEGSKHSPRVDLVFSACQQLEVAALGVMLEYNACRALASRWAKDMTAGARVSDPVSPETLGVPADLLGFCVQAEALGAGKVFDYVFLSMRGTSALGRLTARPARERIQSFLQLV